MERHEKRRHPDEVEAPMTPEPRPRPYPTTMVRAPRDALTQKCASAMQERLHPQQQKGKEPTACIVFPAHTL